MGKLRPDVARRVGRIFSFFFIIAVTFMPSVGQAIPYKALVQDIKIKLGVNEKIAEAFLKYVDDFVTEIQDNFVKIASHETSRYVKKSLIADTMEDYFEDPMNSEIQVSSLSQKSVKTFSVQIYLNRLSKLALRYDTVKLYFDRGYFSMGPIELYQDPYTNKKGYEFQIQVWQMFEGCRGDNNRNICYKDFTKKGFHIVFMLSKRGWAMKVHAITADKTLPSYFEDDTGPGKWR
jgi:hypothetical protein